MKNLKKVLAVAALVSTGGIGSLLLSGVSTTVDVVQRISTQVAQNKPESVSEPIQVGTKLTAMEIFERSPMSFGGYRE